MPPEREQVQLTNPSQMTTTQTERMRARTVDDNVADNGELSREEEDVEKQNRGNDNDTTQETITT